MSFSRIQCPFSRCDPVLSAGPFIGAFSSESLIILIIFFQYWMVSSMVHSGLVIFFSFRPTTMSFGTLSVTITSRCNVSMFSPSPLVPFLSIEHSLKLGRDVAFVSCRHIDYTNIQRVIFIVYPEVTYLFSCLSLQNAQQMPRGRDSLLHSSNPRTMWFPSPIYNLLMDVITPSILSAIIPSDTITCLSTLDF